MKTMLRTTFLVALLASLPLGAAAQSFSINPGTSSGALDIPDDDPVGVSETFVIDEGPDVMISEFFDATLQVTHTWVGDLHWTIESPEGTVVSIMDQPGVPASTFGCSGDNIDTVIDDAGTDGPVEDMCSDLPAIFGNPTPNQPLASFVGENPNGMWTFTISDNAGGDTGTMDFWNAFYNVVPVVANEPGADLPNGYRVSSAYPNPFNPQTQLTIDVDNAQAVSVDVYNALGQQVATIFEGTMGADQSQTVSFEANGLPSGLYIVRVTGESFTTTRSVALLK